MLIYNRYLKSAARLLRKESTKSEKILWKYLHRRQLCGTQFYRQKPIGRYVVDFYCASAKLVIELDGSHHKGAMEREQDGERTIYLKALGLQVVRFDNSEIEQDVQSMLKRIKRQIPPSPFFKGGDLYEKALLKLLNTPFGKGGWGDLPSAL